jgi:hypothetical protein
MEPTRKPGRPGSSRTEPEPDAEPVDRAAPSAPDRTTRQAALWATVIALPLTALVALLVFGQLSPDPVARPEPTPTSARPESTAPVQMAAPRLDERPATVCRALLSRLPAAIRDLGQRPVAAGPEQNAAYGDPALTVACGVPSPTVAPTADLWMVNRVCWLTTHEAGGLVLTTVDREVPVRLTVPAGQEQTVQWAAPVADSVVAAVPSSPTVPEHCAS